MFLWLMNIWRRSKKSKKKSFFLTHFRHFLPKRGKKITPPIAEIIWVKNVRAIVVCGFLIKWLKEYILKIWKYSWVPISTQSRLDWLCYLAGNSLMATTIFFKFSGYRISWYSFRPWIVSSLEYIYVLWSKVTVHKAKVFAETTWGNTVYIFLLSH